MSELISVDFKEGVITSRRDLDNPRSKWHASKDPDFKAYVEAMVSMVEHAYEEGGDWRRIVIALQYDPDDDENCMVVWDHSHIEPEVAVHCLRSAAEKVHSLPREILYPNEPEPT